MLNATLSRTVEGYPQKGLSLAFPVGRDPAWTVEAMIISGSAIAIDKGSVEAFGGAWLSFMQLKLWAVWTHYIACMRSRIVESVTSTPLLNCPSFPPH